MGAGAQEFVPRRAETCVLSPRSYSQHRINAQSGTTGQRYPRTLPSSLPHPIVRQVSMASIPSCSTRDSREALLLRLARQHMVEVISLQIIMARRWIWYVSYLCVPFVPRRVWRARATYNRC
jgi:hypothetical protein